MSWWRLRRHPWDSRRQETWLCNSLSHHSTCWTLSFCPSCFANGQRLIQSHKSNSLKWRVVWGGDYRLEFLMGPNGALFLVRSRATLPECSIQISRKLPARVLEADLNAFLGTFCLINALPPLLPPFAQGLSSTWTPFNSFLPDLTVSLWTLSSRTEVS